MTRSHDAALQAAAFLAEEREKWMRTGECSRQEASDAYLFFSKACRRADKPHEALQALRKSIQLFPKSATDPMLLHEVGTAYGNLGDLSKKRDYLEKALRIKEAHDGLEHVGVAKILYDLGNACGRLGDHEKARDYLERALRIFEAHSGPKGRVGVAGTLNDLALASESLKNHQLAHTYLTRAAFIMELSEPLRSHPHACVIRRNLARIEALKQQNPPPPSPNQKLLGVSCIDTEPIELITKYGEKR
eukprot:4552233-Amphidinium_carterae.1